MDTNAVLCKTEKGHAEIATRANHLPARMRAVLIMVDGHLTGNDILARTGASADAASHLESLFANGYIEAQAPAPAPAPAAAGPGIGDLRAARRVFSAALIDILGPDADLFTGRIDNASSADELRGLADKYRDMLRASGKSRRAEEMWSKVVAALA